MSHRNGSSSSTPVDPVTAGPGHDRYTIQGRTVTLPLHVAHARAGIAVYDADAAAIEANLPSGLSPVVTRPGRGIVLLQLVRYVDNPLGDYDEGVVASVVRPSNDPSHEPGVRASLQDVLGGRHGIFVHHMPVTQAFTREAGERIWGFPKVVDTLDLRIGDRRAGLRWGNDLGEVLELTIPTGTRIPALPPQAGTTFTRHGGVVWRTSLTMQGEGARIGPGGARLRLGNNPIADWLRGLRLSRTALASVWIDHATMDFTAATPLR